MDIDGFIDESKPVLGFAIFGTLLMIAAVSLFLNMVLWFSLLEAFLLGIIIAPTDPVAVINVFQDIGVVKRFQLIVSGESLFNDGIAIALYSIVASIITLGTITTTSVVKIISVERKGRSGKGPGYKVERLLYDCTASCRVRFPLGCHSLNVDSSCGESAWLVSQPCYRFLKLFMNKDEP